MSRPGFQDMSYLLNPISSDLFYYYYYNQNNSKVIQSLYQGSFEAAPIELLKATKPSMNISTSVFITSVKIYITLTLQTSTTNSFSNISSKSDSPFLNLSCIKYHSTGYANHSSFGPSLLRSHLGRLSFEEII